jgi:putative ABC transport system permease protein
MARGISREEAHAALREFGVVVRTAESCRDQRGLPVAETLIREVRHAWHRLAKTPGFTLAALLILTLGIGANSAVFSLMNAILFRPLPYDRADRLVLIWEDSQMFKIKDSPVAPANFTDWRTRNRSFSGQRILNIPSRGKDSGVIPDRRSAGMRALRTRPLIGRIFRREDVGIQRWL